VGQFSAVNRDGTETKGTGMALNVAGSYHLTDNVLVQGRYAYVGQKFLSPQSGLHEPTNLAAAGVSWQPRRWITAGLSASTATTPGRLGQFNRYVTATVNLAPDNAMPAIFVSHTQSSTTQLRNSAFTLVTATKRFNRWHMFVNGARVKTFGERPFERIKYCRVEPGGRKPRAVERHGDVAGIEPVSQSLRF
jgi:hypothetical protein